MSACRFSRPSVLEPSAPSQALWASVRLQASRAEGHWQQTAPASPRPFRALLPPWTRFRSGRAAGVCGNGFRSCSARALWELGTEVGRDACSLSVGVGARRAFSVARAVSWRRWSPASPSAGAGVARPYPHSRRGRAVSPGPDRRMRWMSAFRTVELGVNTVAPHAPQQGRSLSGRSIHGR
jgi:hypothetical protein